MRERAAWKPPLPIQIDQAISRAAAKLIKPGSDLRLLGRAAACPRAPMVISISDRHAAISAGFQDEQSVVLLLAALLRKGFRKFRL